MRTLRKISIVAIVLSAGFLFIASRPQRSGDENHQNKREYRGLPKMIAAHSSVVKNQIVETIHSVKSDKMEPYIEALRRNVCVYCKHQSPDGKCTFRVNLDCGLDRYFPLIIEAIEEVSDQNNNLIIGNILWKN